METTNREQSVEKPKPKPKYPEVNKVLHEAMRHAFDVGEHWAGIPQPKGQADMESFVSRLEVEVDKIRLAVFKENQLHDTSGKSKCWCNPRVVKVKPNQ